MNRRIPALVAIAAAGLAVAGCSATTTSSPSSTPADTSVPVTSASPAAFLVQAADTTAATGSAKISATSTISGIAPGDGGPLTVTANGVVDFADSEASLQVDSAIFGAAGGPLQVILADGASYLKIPMLGDKWIKMPAKDLGLTMTDPTKGLETLRKAADLTEVGTEDVNGVSATKYTGTVDLSEAVAQLGLPTDEQDKVTQELDKVARTAQVTVWVDSEGRIVRYDQELAVNPDGKHVTEPVTVKSSTTMSDFGVATDIQPPPADQVTDGSNLSKLMPGGTPTDGSMPGGMSSGA